MLIRRTCSIAVVSVLAGVLGMFTFAAPIPQQTGTWQLLGSLVDARQGASAMTLDDGRVLVAGGANASGVLASAEIVGADGSKVAVASMNVARKGHTATKLKDGRVLVAGGIGADGNATASAEVFTPGLGSWTPLSMTVARRNHTATFVGGDDGDSGAVIIAGGENAGGMLASLEVFDTTGNAFYPLVGQLSSPRANHAAAALPDGRVIVIGGESGTSVLSSSDIVGGQFGTVSAGPSMGDARKNFTATALLNGDVLVAGGVGGTNGTTEHASAEKFVTAAGIFVPVGGLPGPRQGHQAVRLPNNAGVLVVGGSAFGQPLRSVDLFLPETQGFRVTSPTEIAHTNGALAPVGTGLAIAAGGAGTAALESYAFATVTTDADDYAPGSVVTMSGSGWTPNEPVTLVLRELQQLHPDRTFTALADGLGNFTNSDFIPEEHHLGVRFFLTATQGASEAQHTFTDSRTITAVTLNGGTSPVSVAPGGSITAAVTVTTDGTGNNTRWESTGWRISTTVPGSVTCSDLEPDRTTNGTFTESFSATAPSTPGTYNAYFIAYNNDICSQGASATFTLAGSVIVDGGAPTVSSINRAAGSPTNSSIVSWTVTFNESVTGVDATDFSLVASGVTGALITGVSGTGSSRTVTADSGNGTGTLRLDLVDDDTILDTVGNKLGGNGAGNGNFTGQAYTLSRTLTPTFTADNKVYDGNNTATILTRSFTSPLSTTGFDLEVIGGTATFDNKNVGTGKTVTGTGFSLDGDDAGRRFLLSSTTATTNANITKANAVCSITGYTVTYDGAPHTATGSCLGVEAETLSGLDLSTTTHTNAGNYPTDPWAFTDSTGNYNNSAGTVADSIAKASSTTDVTCAAGPFVYTGVAQTPCSVSVTGVGGLNDTPAPDYASNVNAGTATASYTFAGDANHNGSSDSANFTIDKASSTTTVTCSAGPFVYTGTAVTPCSVSVTGAGGLNDSPAPVYANNVNAGTASASYTYVGDANHNGSNDSENFTIDKASSTTDVTCTAGPFVYTGSAYTPCSVSVTGAGGLSETPTPTYANNVNAGTASASYTYAGDTNHNGSNDSENFTIDKAGSTTDVTCTAGPFVYTGSAYTPCSVSVTGAGGLSETPAPTYANNVNAGTATASYTYAGDANHNGSNDSENFTIDKASSTTDITCTAGPFVYTGSAYTPCSVSVTGAGGLSETPAPTYANNVNAGTATASYTYAGDTNHNGSNDSQDFTIDKAGSTTDVTCTAGPFVYTGSAYTPCSVSVTGAGGLSETPAPTYANNVNAGTATASYTYAGDANHNGSNDSQDFTIDKAGSTTDVTCTAGPFVYSGSAYTPCSVSVTGAGGLSETPAPTYANNVNAGTATASYTYAGDTNHNGSNDSQDFTIDKAGSTTDVTCTAGPFVYTGSAYTPCSVSVTGAGGLNDTPAPTYANNVNAGTATASYTYAGDANHNGSNDSQDFTIDKAASTTDVTCTAGPFVYTGSAYTPCSVSVTGAGGLNETPAPTYANNVNAGTATASYTYAGDTNHNGSSNSQDFTIDKAGSTTDVTCTAGPFVYTGSAYTPCSVSVTGAGGLNETPAPTYANNVNAGTATASYTYAGDANHNGSNDSQDFTIDKAGSTTEVTCTAGPFVYTGSAYTPCSVSVTGAGGLSETPAPTYANNVNAGTATASYTYAGDANHNGSNDSENFTIDKAGSTTDVTCTAGPFVYTGSAYTPCSVSVTGAGGLSETPAPTYANNVNAGTATANYTYAGDANHNGSSDSQDFTIDKAGSTTDVTCTAGPFVYTGSAYTPCSVSVTGAGGLSETPAPTYANNVNAGTATASYTYAGDTNHNGSSDSQDFTIDKAGSTTDVTCTAGPFVYTGSAYTPCSVSVTGAGGLNENPAPTYANNVNAGTATASHTYAGDANHNGSNDSENFTIDKAASTTDVTCTAGPFVYTGSAYTPCSVSVTGAGGLNETPTPTYANNVNAGTATASYSYAGDANHNGSSDSRDFTIDKAASTTDVTCTAGPFAYTGSAYTPCSVSVTGAGGLNETPTPNYANNVNAGTATASYTYAGDANHNGSNDSEDFTIDKAGSTTDVTCAAGPFVYTGSAYTPCSVSVTGAGGLSETPAPTYANNVNAGTATASYTYAGDANHNGSNDSQDFTIDKAGSTTDVTCTAGPFVYTGSAYTPCSVSVMGAGGLSETAAPTYANNVNAGTATVSYTYAGDPNHNGSSDSQDFTIDKAGSTTDVTCTAGPFVYNASAHTPCSVSVTGVGGLNLTPAPTYANNVNAGLATASYSYAGDANHTGSSDSQDFTIDPASSATLVWCPVNVTFDGSAQTPCTVAVTGAGGLNLTPAPTYANNTNAGTATASYTYAGDPNHTGSNDSENFTIDPAASTTVVTCTAGPFTYTGSAFTPCSVSVTGAGGLNLTPAPSYASNTNAGTATASYTYTGDPNHTGSNDSENFTIDPASSTTTVTCTAGPFVYTGSAFTPCSVSVTGAGSLNLTPAPSYANNTNAGTATASYTYAGDANHTGSNDSENFTIDPASSTTTVMCTAGPFVYTGSAFTPCSVSVTGAGSLNLTPAPSYANNANAGTATASYTFTGDSNHTGSDDSENFTIAQASSTTVVTCTAGPFTYNALPQTPCSVSVTGAGDLNNTPAPSYTNNTNAGTATASYTFTGDTNHTGSSDSKNFTIDKASSTTTVTFETGPYTYRGTAFVATAQVTGVGGLNQAVTPVTYGGDCTNVTVTDGCSASATFAGDLNHNTSSNTKTITINKKAASITAKNKNKIFGALMTPDNSDPSPDFEVAGLVLGDSVSTITLASTGYPAAAAPGSHDINPSNPAGSGVGNYNFAYTKGTLNVTYSYTACMGSAGHAILNPINPDGTSVFKQKSTVPAKFRVCDANGNSVGAPGTVTGFFVIMASVGTYSEANEVPDSTTPDTAFRWDPTDKQWIFNISTKSMGANQTYRFRIALNDGSFIDFQFGLK